MKLKFSAIHILLFFVFFATTLQAQTFALQGKVVDDQMNPIEFATVSCVSQGKTTMTSLQGEFSLQLMSADSVEVRFSMIGYKSKIRTLFRPKGKQTLQITLYPANYLLDDVEVKGERIQTGQTQELRKKDIKNAPSASGNAVESLIQSQAGVSTHSELSSQYNVRGGSFSENSVYINNIEIYRPFLVRSGQQEGLSVINPDMVEKIGFSTGGFAAKYSDKMSSVLDITYRRPERFEASLTGSLLGGSAYIALANKKFSWSNGVRYKTNKYLLNSLQTRGEYQPNFLDYQTYLVYTPNRRWRADFIGNISDSHYQFTPKDRNTNFGTLKDIKSFKVYFDGMEKDRFLSYFGSFSVTRLFGDSTRVSLFASAFSTDEQEKYDIQSQYWLTQTETSENLGVGTFFQHARNYLKADVESFKLLGHHQAKHHTVEGAFTYKFEHIRENSVQYEMRDSSGYSIPHTGKDLYMIYSLRAKNKLNANRIEAYLQDTYRFSSKEGNTHFTLNCGLRLSSWSFNKETVISPRVSLGIIPPFNENVTLRFATGIYYQVPFFKEIRDTTTIEKVTYARLNEKAKSQRSIHFIAGYDYRFRLINRPFKFSSEVYCKLLSNLVPYSVNNLQVVYYGDNIGSGYATGLDLKLYGEFVPGTDSWISLSLMKTGMKLNGKTIPLPTDQRYAVNMFFTDYFPGTERWKLSLRLAFADGLPFSAPHRELENNSFRASAYRRIDLGMSYRLINNEDRQANAVFRNIWMGIEALNLFGINNVNSYYWVTDVQNHQYAVPNYLTGRLINFRVLFEF